MQMLATNDYIARAIARKLASEVPSYDLNLNRIWDWYLTYQDQQNFGTFKAFQAIMLEVARAN